MQYIYDLAVFTLFLYVLIEVSVFGYLVVNRRTAVPRIRTALRSILGLEADLFKAQTEREVLHRKLNYVCKHVKFERETLRSMGVLRDHFGPEGTGKSFGEADSRKFLRGGSL